MLRHVVPSTLADPSDAATLATTSHRGRDGVPGMLAFDVAVRSGGLDADGDVFLDSTFAAAPALDAYLGHSHRRAVAPRPAARGKSRAMLDDRTDSAVATSGSPNIPSTTTGEEDR